MSVVSSRCTSTDSRPPLTRESTNSNAAASVLPTPMDYPFHGTVDSKSVVAPIDNVRVRTPSQDRLDGHLHRLNSQRSPGQDLAGEGQAVDSYFPPTAVRPATPVRNTSAKELINRYEAMVSSPIRTSTKSSTASPLSQRCSSPQPSLTPSRPLSALKQRSRSPLRDSFRNLMSFFGKKGKGKAEDTSFMSSRYEDSAIASPAIGHATSPQIHQQTPIIIEDQSPLRSGPVLYLAHPNSDSTLPVWMNCKASLLEDRIKLEWLTAYGNPASSTIFLKKSADVHSLAKSQVDPVEKSLLPLSGQDSYIFELTYSGGPPEKFAMSSVAERSAWVSCIWDVLLKLERTDDLEPDGSSDSVNKNERSAVCGTDLVPQDPFVKDSPTLSNLRTDVSSTRLTREHSEASYAASSTLVAQSMIDSIRTSRLSVDTTSLSREDTSLTPATPTRSTRLGDSTELLPARNPSPSVQNLGNLSIVQSRLSELHASKVMRNVGHASTQVSRRSSLASRYTDLPSRAPSYLSTPQSLPKVASRQTSQASKSVLSRAASLNSEYEDDQSIYDFYAQGASSYRGLPRIPDETESQTADTPRVNTTSTFRVPDIQPPRDVYNRNVGPSSSGIQLTDVAIRERPLPEVPAPLNRRKSHMTISVFNDVPKQSKPVNEPTDLHPLLALIQDHAAQQYTQTSGIGDQVATLQQDIMTMYKELRTVIVEQAPGSALRGMLEDLCAKMERTAASSGTGLQELHQKIDLVASQLSAQISAQKEQDLHLLPPPPPAKETTSQSTVDPDKLEKIGASVDEARDIVRSDLPIIKEHLSSLLQTAGPTDVSHIDAKLDELLEMHRSLQQSRADSESEAPVSSVQELRNVPPEVSSSGPEAKEEGGEEESQEKNQPDIPTETDVAEDKPRSVPEIESKLSEVLTLLKGEEEGRKLVAGQQAENARYLQELNTWLGSFVNNGTTQIQNVANNVESICRELAPQQAEGTEASGGSEAGGIRSEIASLATAVKAIEERDSALKGLMTETLETVKVKEAENKALDMDTVVQMIERQKQEQEAMLRNIAAELSNDIRGERLRFVEAMKEATAINVQVHVEEFKKELGKEVMMMTCEVGRLQRERQMLEQQIADLFTFFAKQRAEMLSEQNQAELVRQSLQVPSAPPTRSNSRARPLPVPK